MPVKIWVVWIWIHWHNLLLGLSPKLACWASNINLRFVASMERICSTDHLVVTDVYHYHKFMSKHSLSQQWKNLISQIDWIKIWTLGSSLRTGKICSSSQRSEWLDIKIYECSKTQAGLLSIYSFIDHMSWEPENTKATTQKRISTTVLGVWGIARIPMKKMNDIFNFWNSNSTDGCFFIWGCLPIPSASFFPGLRAYVLRYQKWYCISTLCCRCVYHGKVDCKHPSLSPIQKLYVDPRRVSSLKHIMSEPRNVGKSLWSAMSISINLDWSNVNRKYLPLHFWSATPTQEGIAMERSAKATWLHQEWSSSFTAPLRVACRIWLAWLIISLQRKYSWTSPEGSQS